MKPLSKFQKSWRSKPGWSAWLRSVPASPNLAHCLLCNNDFSLSSMGAQAVTSHSKSIGHRKACRAVVLQPSAQLYSMAVNTSEPSGEQPSTSSGNSELPAVHVPPAPSTPFSSSQSFADKKLATHAEIVWCLKVVSSHFSSRSCDGLPSIFASMFPDSAIAKQFSLGRDKASYTITYGLGPYFYELLTKRLAACDELVICFDEALNKVSQRGQMDLVARYWDIESNSVVSRYLGSSFLGRATATLLAEAFKNGLKDVPIVKVIQISMDGPAVNHKFYSDLKKELIVTPETPNLIDTGSCGLHVVSGAFQTGHRATGWNINKFLRNIYWLFKDSPARRASFIEITSSSVFPLKFCTVRWVENARVADRAIKMVPHLKKWVTEVRPKPTSQLFDEVKTVVNDSLLLPRLHVFKFIASLLDPFLTEFQSQPPLFPFLYEELEELLRSLMVRCVKDDVLAPAGSAFKLTQIALDNSDSLKVKVDIGFGAVQILSNANLSQLQSVGFHADCKKFFVSTIRKIVERSPLKYKIVRGASSLSPLLIALQPKKSEQRFEAPLSEFVSNNRLNSEVADRAKRQFTKFVANQEVKATFRDFKRKDCRLDALFVKCLQELSGFDDLFTVVKKVLILSHGNAAVESGFSVNEDLLCENLTENSLVAQRLVYDAVCAHGGVLQVPLLPSLERAVKMARQKYREALETKRTADQRAGAAAVSRKRRAKEELEELQGRSVALKADTSSQLTRLQRQMADLQKVMDS